MKGLLPQPCPWRTALDRAATFLEQGEKTGDPRRLADATRACEQAVTAAKTAEQRAEARRRLSAALRSLGVQTGGVQAMAGAVAAARAALPDTEPDARPRTYALLGAAQTVLGEHASDPVWLAAAIESYRVALAAGSREETPDDWARMQRNLGAVLCLRGQLVDDAGALAEAIGCGWAALEVYPPGSQDWAMTQSNLADALRTLGERMGDAAALERSAAACRAALSVYARDAFPRDWAMTSTNLANALAALGGRQRLEEAVALYRDALAALDDPQLAPAIRYNLRRAEVRLGSAPRLSSAAPPAP